MEGFQWRRLQSVGVGPRKDEPLQAEEAAEKKPYGCHSEPACARLPAGQAGEAKNLLSLKRKNKADSLPAGRRARANNALGMTDRAFFSSH
jgi:hypothetical protein